MLTTVEVKKLKEYVAALQPTRSGKFFYNYFAFRKKIVLKNLRLVFGKFLDSAEIEKLAVAFYSHVITSIRESIQMRFMSTEKIRQRAIVIGEENLANASGDSIRGALVLTGHFGNWEFAPIAGILNFKKFLGQFFFVRRAQKVRLIEKIFFKKYFDAGLGVIYKKNSLMQVYEKLENNQIVVMVMDQYAKGKEGIPVEFLGHTTRTYRTVAMMARDSGVPVIPARSYRRKDGSHVLEFFPPLPWLTHEDPLEEVALNTRQYNQVLEKLVLEYPEQWLWLYNRWKEIKHPLEPASLKR